MAVFVTGGTGFIGSHLVEALVRNNEQVYALARKTSNRTDQLKKLGVTLIDGDVTDASSCWDSVPNAVTLCRILLSFLLQSYVWFCRYDPDGWRLLR
jgi:nucleoside-diphosphate-sugar epimerase